MTRLDNFLDALAACFVVAVFAASVIVILKLGVYLPLGILGPVLIFFAGAAIGALILYYAVGGPNEKGVTQ